MFEPSNSKPIIFLIEIGENSKPRYFLIQRAWTQTFLLNSKTDIKNITFKYSYITKLGEIDNIKTQIHGKVLNLMVVVYNLKKRYIFIIYDKMPSRSTSQNMNFVKILQCTIVR